MMTTPARTAAPRDFPAAHSMDTAWFAVDGDGHLAMFRSGEEGPVPCAWKKAKHTKRFLNDIGYWAQAGSDDEADEWGVRTFPFLEIPRAEVFDYWSGMLRCYFLQPSPAKPFHWDQLTAPARARLNPVRFDMLRFAHKPVLQPVEFMPCLVWDAEGPSLGPVPLPEFDGFRSFAYLWSDGRTIRAVPGKESDYAHRFAALRHWAATHGFEVELPPPDFPAAHSGDVKWFAVDAEANVGVFCASEQSAIPWVEPSEREAIRREVLAPEIGAALAQHERYVDLVGAEDPEVLLLWSHIECESRFIHAEVESLSSNISEIGFEVEACLHPWNSEWYGHFDDDDTGTHIAARLDQPHLGPWLVWVSDIEAVRAELDAGIASLPPQRRSGPRGVAAFSDLPSATARRLLLAGECLGLQRSQSPLYLMEPRAQFTQFGLHAYDIVEREDLAYGLTSSHQYLRDLFPTTPLGIEQLSGRARRIAGRVRFPFAFGESPFLQPELYVPCRRDVSETAFVERDGTPTTALATNQAYLAFLARQTRERDDAILEAMILAEQAGDFPAAHSTDTDWFAVDRDGHVGLFRSGENGPVPLAAFCGEHGGDAEKELHQIFLASPGCAFVNRFGPDIFGTDQEKRHLGIWTVDDAARLGPIVLYLRSIEGIRAELVGGQARLAAAWEVQAVLFHELPVLAYRRLHQAGDCLGCFAAFDDPGCRPEDLGTCHPRHFGLYVYRADDEHARGSYFRTDVPGRPLQFDNLPVDLRTSFARVEYSTLRFAEAERVNPQAYHAVGYGAFAYLDPGGTVRALAGCEDHYRKFYAEILRQVLEDGWRIEPPTGVPWTADNPGPWLAACVWGDGSIHPIPGQEEAYRQWFPILQDEARQRGAWIAPPPDFPTAHSMDTTWYAVDRDGRVARFVSGEEGAVPADCQSRGADPFAPAEVEQAVEFSYRCEFGWLGLYTRGQRHGRRPHAPPLSDGVRAALEQTRLDSVRFAEAKYLQPTEYFSCDVWRGGQRRGPVVLRHFQPFRECAFLGQYGEEIHPLPDRNLEYRQMFPALRVWASMEQSKMRLFDPLGDYVWAACDREGHLGLFFTSYGCVPTRTLRHTPSGESVVRDPPPEELKAADADAFRRWAGCSREDACVPVLEQAAAASPQLTLADMRSASQRLHLLTESEAEWAAELIDTWPPRWLPPLVVFTDRPDLVREAAAPEGVFVVAGEGPVPILCAALSHETYWLLHAEGVCRGCFDYLAAAHGWGAYIFHVGDGCASYTKIAAPPVPISIAGLPPAARGVIESVRFDDVSFSHEDRVRLPSDLTVFQWYNL